ncbi:MAG: hypothetical protein LC808_06900 [Actinobacteria bacterium]|nr:hypothetical protein [Actinomycetota bacterium]
MCALRLRVISKFWIPIHHAPGEGVRLPANQEKVRNRLHVARTGHGYPPKTRWETIHVGRTSPRAVRSHAGRTNQSGVAVGVIVALDGDDESGIFIDRTLEVDGAPVLVRTSRWVTTGVTAMEGTQVHPELPEAERLSRRPLCPQQRGRVLCAGHEASLIAHRGTFA